MWTFFPTVSQMGYREGNKTSQDTSHWAYNWYVTNKSCTTSYRVSNQSEFDF